MKEDSNEKVRDKSIKDDPSPQKPKKPAWKSIPRPPKKKGKKFEPTITIMGQPFDPNMVAEPSPKNEAPSAPEPKVVNETVPNIS